MEKLVVIHQGFVILFLFFENVTDGKVGVVSDASIRVMFESNAIVAQREWIVAIFKSGFTGPIGCLMGEIAFRPAFDYRCELFMGLAEVALPEIHFSFAEAGIVCQFAVGIVLLEAGESDCGIRQIGILIL